MPRRGRASTSIEIAGSATVFRYNGWRKAWVVSGQDGSGVEVPEQEFLEFLESELEKRGRREE